MLISAWRTILIFLCVAAHSGSGLTKPILLSRQSAGCVTECQPMQTSISGAEAGDLLALCTQDVVNEYQACLTCRVATSVDSEPAAQAIIDSLVDSCKAGGKPINGVTVAADTPAGAPVSNTPETTAVAASATSDTATDATFAPSATFSLTADASGSGISVSSSAPAASQSGSNAKQTGAGPGSPVGPTPANPAASNMGAPATGGALGRYGYGGGILMNALLMAMLSTVTAMNA
ncbi:hypothetical protein C8R43DRAFT_1234046 [Mycena crocata]|nr:hypothetical protein C8R43DRAFT_1234046 [Mycena crocata]